ncbi:MAG: TldD/PmbA family protein, partial [Pseudomonadota bacterium]
STSVSVRGGIVEETERSEGDDLGLRVFVGRKQAIVSTNDVDPAGFDGVAERAVAMAKVAPNDPYADLAPAEKLATAFPDLDLMDSALPEASALADAARRGEDAARGVKGVSKIDQASSANGLGGVVLVTSNGFSGAYGRTTHSVSVVAIAGEGTGMERDYDWHSAVHLADLDDPAEIGRSAGERTVARLNPQKMETQTAPVIFERRAASTLLMHLTGAINGTSIARGASFLKERMDTPIFSSGITITDTPDKPRGAASRPFDGEGLPARPLTLVEDGVLKTWLLDLATARQLDLISNGRASRGASSAPSPSSTNVTMSAGTESLEAMMARLGTGLLVTGFLGRGANLVTGDYSRGANGFWFENGRIVHPVAEVTIAGHLNEMFMAAVPASDLVIRGAVNAPSVHVGEMTIAGR